MKWALLYFYCSLIFKIVFDFIFAYAADSSNLGGRKDDGQEELGQVQAHHMNPVQSGVVEHDVVDSVEQPIKSDVGK